MPYSGPASAWGTTGQAEIAYVKMVTPSLPEPGVWTGISRGCSRLLLAVYWSVDEFLAHHFSVRPLLNRDLAHFERSPVGMIGIDAVNNERLVV